MMHDVTHFLASLVVLLPAFIIGLSFHEFSHARVAVWLGDDTPKRMGRLTLNPIAHIDPFGLLFLILFKFGWAKPVIFDQHNFKHPRFYSILTALAGPLSNFFLALACFYGITYLPAAHLPHAATVSFLQILQATAYINIMLGVFNLLPIPPLDGSHVLTAFLVKKYPEVVLWIYQYSFFILIGLLLLPPTQRMLFNLMAIAEHLLKMLVF